MDGRATASAAIQRSSQYEELVRRQLNYSADSSISNSLSLPPYDETDGMSNDSEGNPADDCSTASSNGRKQDIREVQDYLERLDQKRGILERHASAELVRPATIPADGLRRTGSASLPTPAKQSGGSRGSSDSVARQNGGGSSSRGARPPREPPSTKSGAASEAASDQQQGSQPQPPPVLRTALTTARAATAGSKGGAPGSAPAGGSAAAAAAAGEERRHNDIYINRSAEASYSAAEDAAMPHASAEAGSPAPLQVADLAVVNGGDSASATVAVLKARLAAREDEVQRLSAQVHMLRDAGRCQSTDAAGTDRINSEANDRRLAAVLREKSELERKCDDLLREKENLTTELRKLHEQMEAAAAATLVKTSAHGSDEAGVKAGATQASLPLATADERLLSYRPDNPNALQRKIDDLECQIQDLVEANETACEEVQRLENENQQLCEEIGSLKASHEMALLELEGECRRLQDKLAQLPKKSINVGDIHFHSEMQQLNIDLRAQQEKNRVLAEENAGLRNALNESSGQRLSASDLSTKHASHYRSTTESSAHPSYIDDIIAEDSCGGSSLAALHRLQRAAADVTTGGHAPAEPRGGPSGRQQQTELLPKKIPAAPHTSDGSANGGTADAHRRRSDGGVGLSAPDVSTGKADSRRPPAGASLKLVQPRSSSPAGRSDMSDSTAILLASYEPVSRRSAAAARGRPSSPAAYGNGLCSSSDRGSAPDGPLAGGRSTLPLYLDEDDGRSDTTADILQDVTTYLRSSNGETQRVNAKTSPVKGEMNRSAYEVAVNGRHSVDSSMSSSLSSLNEQPLEEEDFAEPVHSPRQSNGSAGLRSVSAPLQVTQHNRNSFDGSSSTLNVGGRRPFAPRTPADVRLGDVIKYTRPDCRIARGTVKFIGHLHNKNDTFIGIETEYNDGKHDGVYDGSRYFQCKPNRGAFIPFNKVIMIWGS